jgi:hypothetical protein
MKRFFTVLLLVPFHIYSQEVDASDILFLKIQELEGELASLRSELESQAYLIEKLLNETLINQVTTFHQIQKLTPMKALLDLKELMIAKVLMRFMIKRFLS